MEPKIISPSSVVIAANFEPSLLRVVSSFKAVSGYRDRKSRFGDAQYKTPICIFGAKSFLCVYGANDLIGYVLARGQEADIFEMNDNRDIPVLRKRFDERSLGSVPGVFFETSETRNLSSYGLRRKRREPSQEEIMVKNIRGASTIEELRKSIDIIKKYL